MHRVRIEVQTTELRTLTVIDEHTGAIEVQISARPYSSIWPEFWPYVFSAVEAIEKRPD